MSSSNIPELQEANKLLQQGNSLLNKKGWFGILSNPSYSEAADCFTRAGNLFKSIKHWHEAARAFSEAAKLQQNTNDEDPSRNLLSAASCYKKGEEYERALEILEMAMKVFLKGGRFMMAAAQEKEMAEICENIPDKLALSIKHYIAAADRYQAEDQKAAASACQLKAAHLSALSGNYQQSIDIFEELAQLASGDPIRKYAIKELVLKAGMCRFALGEDIVATKRAIETHYPSLDASLPSTREYQLLTGLLDAIDQNDPNLLAEHVEKFDQVAPLDDWQTKILLNIKKSIQEQDTLT